MSAALRRSACSPPLLPVRRRRQTGGTFLGTVLDDQGLALPGATVTFSQPGDRLDPQRRHRHAGPLPRSPRCRRACIRSRRSWRASTRPSGSSVPLTLGQELTVNMTMKVATLQETVTVSAAVPLVETTSNTLGTTVSREQLDALPVPGTHLHRAGPDRARGDRRRRRRRECRRPVEPQQLVPHRRRQQRQQRARQPARRPLDGGGARIRRHRQPVLGGTRRRVRRHRQRRHPLRAPTTCRAAASCSTATNRSTRRIRSRRRRARARRRSASSAAAASSAARSSAIACTTSAPTRACASIRRRSSPRRSCPPTSARCRTRRRAISSSSAPTIASARTTRCSCATASTSRSKRTAASAG